MKKICTSCKEKKNIDEFYKMKGYKDGYRAYCKKCFNFKIIERSRQIILENKPNCISCGKKLGLKKRFYCSHRCLLDYMKKSGKYKEQWKKQKADPAYAEYHRKIAREWERNKTAMLSSREDK